MMRLNYSTIDSVLAGKGILYHGTNRDIKRIELKKCRKYTDFGRGFYLTSSRQQAEKWAKRQNKRYINAEQSDYIKENSIPVRAPIIIPFKVDQNKATKYLNRLSMVGEVPVKGDINIKIFDKTSPEWAEFVLNNRISNFTDFSSLKYNGDSKYGVVIGPVADGNNLEKIIEDYEEYNRKRLYDNTVTKPDFKTIVNDLTYRKECNDQYSFHTYESIKMLTKFDPIYLDVNKVYKESIDSEEFSIFEYSVPLIVKNIILLLIENSGYSEFKAEKIFYSSKTYDLLQDIETGLYEESSYFVYRLLQDEMKYGYIVQREF